MTILHFDALPSATRGALERLKEKQFFEQSNWYLAGGTALTLQARHRQSDDLDFFCTQKFKESALERALFETGEWVTSMRDEGTLYGEFMGAKASFIFYPFFRPSSERIHFGKISILVQSDIAAMKIIAISQRGKKRDFVDLFWYVNNIAPLEDAIKAAILQYPGKEHNIPHILKSLVYFEDAEADPMPKLFFKADWKTIKSYFKREIPKIARELLL